MPGDGWATVLAVSYAPQPGYPGYHGPPPGYGQYGGPPRPSTALAYIVVGIFLVCGGFTLLGSITALEGESPDILASVVGFAFTEDATGNMDFAISMSMSVACSTLTTALVMIARLEFVRWILGFLGGLTTIYYIYAIIWLIDHESEDYVLLPIVALLLWAGGTVVVLLPQTARAMRGYQRKVALGHVQPPY